MMYYVLETIRYMLLVSGSLVVGLGSGLLIFGMPCDRIYRYFTRRIVLEEMRRVIE